jgi:hypothetical protein
MLKGLGRLVVTTPRGRLNRSRIRVPRAGFGPATSRLVVCRSIPLSYRGTIFLRSGIALRLGRSRLQFGDFAFVFRDLTLRIIHHSLHASLFDLDKIDRR